ncbi:hypothetical protein KCH_62260 [Kitasatospora cheerisanensis KCTC 2395]|uniref:Uncharacterized protein n=1 Tax=Kitasatospora cheerisanensis KCTC 2395 TaxID=1348663 RepID=A0A066YLN7_9ACTN|nr:hypothetical protein KCH_62260 [Kitasatospora cheerisanensis KCTC 2395]
MFAGPVQEELRQHRGLPDAARPRSSSGTAAVAPPTCSASSSRTASRPPKWSPTSRASGASSWRRSMCALISSCGGRPGTAPAIQSATRAVARSSVRDCCASGGAVPVRYAVRASWTGPCGWSGLAASARRTASGPSSPAIASRRAESRRRSSTRPPSPWTGSLARASASRAPSSGSRPTGRIVSGSKPTRTAAAAR